ncbi:MAG: hypothetical protein ACI4NZ_02660 [Candidatus Enterousia sp.]
MKKIILILPTMLLCSCVRPVHYPYTGTKTITGEGGFIEKFIPVEHIGHSIFEKKTDYKYNGVAFFRSGLPMGAKCTLKGYIAEPNLTDVAKSALQQGANVATKSTFKLSKDFDNNGGQLDETWAAGDWYSIYDWQWYNWYWFKIAKGYNIFECK